MRQLKPGQVWRDDSDCIMITEVISDDYVIVKGIAVLNGVPNVQYSSSFRYDVEWDEFPTLVYDFDEKS